MELEIANFNEGIITPSTSLSGLGWDVLYEANELPDAATPAWTKTGGVTAEISPAGFLHAVSGNGLGYRIEDANISNSVGVTMEARLKVISGQVNDWPDWVNASSLIWTNIDGTKYISFWFYSDGVWAWPSENNYLMDTTDDYHTYHFTVKNDVAKLYIDGVLRLTETSFESLVQNKNFSFDPDGNWVAGIETSWDYVYYSYGGAFVP